MHTPPSLIRGAASAALVAIAAAMLWAPAAEAQGSAHAMYTRALARERALRDAANTPTLRQIRSVIAAYESVVRRYPRSGYSDNALWQGGNLALLAYERFGQPSDRQAALRLLNLLKSEYASSSLVPRVAEAVRQVEAARAARTATPPVRAATSRSTPAPAPPPPSRPAGAEPSAAVALAAASEKTAASEPASGGAAADPHPGGGAGIVTIRDIRRTPLPDGVRVSIEMDGEVLYRSDRLENPSRVFFDLHGTRTVLSLQDASISFGDDLVRAIRLGRRPGNTTRIVMDLDAVGHFSTFTLYEPFRLIVDFHRTPPALRAGTPPAGAADRPVSPSTEPLEPTAGTSAGTPVPLVTRPVPPDIVPPAAPAANASGQFSIARQLGLGVARIVLDAGHGGHDPGARANGVSEAALVLDVTLRLRALLEKQPGVEVTLTRDRDVFVPLEERTAIANREGADLFLSIHANASRNASARGIETYFLNFATNREAEAVAARENSASGRTMHNLPDIVKAIALNNKIDESRDFAALVQQAMVKRLSTRNREIRNLGVKQAPFVVLIGASMPSILAEISFVTNRQEAALLKTPAYRQQIAEALLDGILRYQGTLKGARAIAAR